MNEIAEDFKQIKISRLTLGLIMSVAITSGVVVWHGAQVANRIGDLEHTQSRSSSNKTTEPTQLYSLD